MARQAALFVLILAVLLHSKTGISAAPPNDSSLRNRPILSEPLLGRKLILAHHMTAWLGWEKAPDVGINFDPVPTEDVVGSKSVAPMYGLVRSPKLLPLEDAVRHEIKSATRMGLDGFQFFFPIHMHDGFLRNYSTIVKTFIQQAEEHQPDFRVTLCLCAPNRPASEDEMRAQWAQHIRWILQDTKDSPIWVRSPDGRLVFYTWVPDGLMDPPSGGKRPHIHSRAGIAAAAAAYEKLAHDIGERIAFIYHMRGVSADWYANLIYDYFPAAWRWVDGDMSKDVPRLTDLARQRKRLFSPTVYPAFYGHTYRDNDGNPNGSGKVGRDPLEQLWRPYHKTDQTRLYRNLLKSSVEADAQLISFVTWNDITEDTQLMPEANRNFALGVLLNHYRNLWLGQPEKNDREIAIVAYKKHPLDQPVRDDVSLRVEHKDDFHDLANESRIEVITILQSPAAVYLNGRHRGRVSGGLNSTSVPFESGRVRVEIKRKNKTIIQLAPSEWITTAPRRVDPVSVMLSSEFPLYFRNLFGQMATPYRLREYAR